MEQGRANRFLRDCREKQRTVTDFEYLEQFCECLLARVATRWPSFAALETSKLDEDRRHLDAMFQHCQDADRSAYARLLADREKECRVRGAAASECSCLTAG